MNELTAQISALLKSAAPRESVLEQVLRATLTRFNSETGTIHQFNDGQKLLHLVAQTGLPPQLLDVVKTIPLGKGIAGQVAAENRPVTICNLQTDAGGVAKPAAKQTGVGGALCVPIRHGDKIAGTLGIGTRREHEYSAAEINLLQEVANLIAPHFIMSNPTPEAPAKSAASTSPVPQAKINLRRPDIMEQVQAQVLSHYRSEIVENIREHGGVLAAGDLTVKLAKEFGFCYGVERAIDLAYAAKKYFAETAPHKPIYLLGEIIHNPEVNDQISNLGIQIISPKPTNDELASLNSGDAVIIPAFGTEVGTRKKIEAKGCIIVDTTCGDVMSVWKRVRQYSKESVTSIIHGKAKHEETKATTSQARAYGSGHYLVVFNLAETDYVCNYILNGGNKQEFLEKFKGAHSEGFDPDLHLQAVGVANQTTMLRGETEEVQRRFKAVMEKKFGAPKVESHFRFFDTICGATQDRQDALQKMLKEPLNLLIVVGGYNSSNTSHLAEMGEQVLPTFFIKNAAKMQSDKLIVHYDQHQKKEVETRDWLPSGKITVGITAGASCPNNLIEDTLRRLFELRGIAVQELLKN